MNNEKDFTRFLTAQADYYGAKMSTDIVAMWIMDLERFELEDIKRALHEHRRASRFFPKISEILAILNPEPRSPLVAWAEVEKAMLKVGSYETVQFSDPITNSVVSDLGWPWLCVQDIGEPWTQKEFERRYAAYQKEGINRSQPIMGLMRSNSVHIVGDVPKHLPPPDRSGEVLAKLKKMTDIENRE